MGLEYRNRAGDRYFVLHRATKTGKTSYYCSKKPGENAVDELPAGYELRENPITAIVTVRKSQASSILPLEEEFLRREAIRLSGINQVIVDREPQCLVVYTPDTNEAGAIRMLSYLAGPNRVTDTLVSSIINENTFSPMLRFMLTDADERLFTLERWCFSGSIDDWIYVCGDESLDDLARRYLPHLGRDSFFEME